MKPVHMFMLDPKDINQMSRGKLIKIEAGSELVVLGIEQNHAYERRVKAAAIARAARAKRGRGKTKRSSTGSSASTSSAGS